MEFTSESLSDPGEEPECVGVACPPEDARAPSASPAMVQKLLRRPAAKQRPMCNEHGTVDAIPSDFGDRMTTQHLDKYDC